MEGASLQGRILARHKSIYAFCKAEGLAKSTVYHVLGGRYAGDMARQRRRIEKALAGGAAGPDEAEIMTILGRVACAGCTRGKKSCRKSRHRCKELWQAQARELLKAGR